MRLVVDSREQLPYTFDKPRYAGVEVVKGCLKTGDYTIEGHETEIICERKSLDDLIGSITSGRERFEREMMRAAGLNENGERDENVTKIEKFYLIIEATSLDISRGLYTSRMNPHAALQTIWSWHQKYGVIPIYAGNRDGGEYHCWTLFRWFMEHKSDK